MICPKCLADIPDNSIFCKECGARLQQNGYGTDPLYEGSDAEVYPEIARANLLRLQSKWDEAIEVCIGVLRRFPNNETAHALLGDIYADQGKLDDAIEWYELAVELNPANNAYRNKLEQLRSLETLQETKAPSPALPPPPEARPAGGWSPPQRIWVYTLFGFVVLALLTSAFLAGWRKGQTQANVLKGTTGASFPAASSPLNAPLENPVTPPPGLERPPVISEMEPPTMLTAQEIEFLNQLAQRLRYPHSRLWGSYNPLTNQWTVRAFLESGVLSRERVLRESLLIGWTGLSILQEAASITVILMVPGKQPSANDLLFAGEISRPPAGTPDPRRLTSAEIEPFFRSTPIWWNPAIPLSP